MIFSRVKMEERLQKAREERRRGTEEVGEVLEVPSLGLTEGVL